MAPVDKRGNALGRRMGRSDRRAAQWVAVGKDMRPVCAYARDGSMALFARSADESLWAGLICGGDPVVAWKCADNAEDAVLPLLIGSARRADGRAARAACWEERRR